MRRNILPQRPLGKVVLILWPLWENASSWLLNEWVGVCKTRWIKAGIEDEVCTRRLRVYVCVPLSRTQTNGGGEWEMKCVLTRTHRLGVWCFGGPAWRCVCVSDARVRGAGPFVMRGVWLCAGSLSPGRVISADPLWQTLRLHYVTGAQVSHRPRSNRLSDSSARSPHHSSAVLPSVCVSVRVKPRFCAWSHICSHRLFWGTLLLITF